jgi:lambda family phage minor tail protein L
MAENLIVKDTQKLDPASGLVELFEIEYNAGSFIYAHAGLEADLTTVQFRDYTTTSTIRTYIAIPMEVNGFEHKATGAIARPTISIANATTAFSGAIGSIDFDTLVGLKVIRRLTLNKYLYGNAGDAQPPVEFPREVWYIDSIKSRDKAQVTFELSSPFDLQGLKVPTREIVSNRCPWIYQASSSHLDDYKKVGGCTWNIESTYAPAYSGSTEFDGSISHLAYVNQDDEQIVPSGTTFATWSGGDDAITKDGFYKTSSTSTKIDADGSTTAASTVTDYWQATVTDSEPGTPTDINSNFKRVCTYTTYSHGTEYFAYTSDIYNDYVKFTDNVASSATNGKTLLWKVRTSSVNVPPAHGDYWERGDLCSKTMDGCKMRFGYNPLANTANQLAKTSPDTTAVLPFGGFPASKAFK